MHVAVALPPPLGEKCWWRYDCTVPLETLAEGGRLKRLGRLSVVPGLANHPAGQTRWVGIPKSVPVKFLN